MTEGNGQRAESIRDLYLADFQKNNPQCNFSIDSDKFIIEKAWAVDSVRFVFGLDELESLKDINSVAFLPRFDAIFHLDHNEVEFFYAYLNPREEPETAHVNRSFSFSFMGQNFHCRFKEPSERLYLLARKMRRFPQSSGENVAEQLTMFQDAQRGDKLPPRVKEFFEERVPRNFFISTDKNILDCDWEKISRHINFYMCYYDRKTPSIVIRGQEKTDDQKYFNALRFLGNSFPLALAAHEVDDFILQLIEVARLSSPRFAFIYYYQVMEYAGFYFMDEKAKKQIRHFLTDPAMIMCPEDKIADLLTVLSELQQNDDVKMRKVIDDYCDPKVLWNEIENDKDFFATEICFDGGCSIPALIANNTTVETWCTMWAQKTYDNLTKIRNCLVHARERRLSQAILPTPNNARHIERYLPLIKRLAEQIALTKI